MGILRRLREWREDKDGTLIGPNIEADSVDAGSVNTGDATVNNKIIIDRSQYLDHIQQIDNSGSDVSIDTSALSTVENEPQFFIVDLYFSTGQNTTELQLRLNGDGSSTGQYVFTTRSGTQTTGADEIKITQPANDFDVVFTRIEIAPTKNQQFNFDTKSRINPSGVAESGRRESVNQINSIDIIVDGSAESLVGHVYRRRLD